MASKQGVRVYKLVVLGDGGVGKSALTMQFVCREFLNYHDPTIEDSYQHQARIDGEPAQLDILDTAGQPEFTAMREQYMRTGEGFLVCYSVTDRRSFEEAIAYKQLINRVRKRDDIPLVLVGNKCDLHENRNVYSEEGRALASQWECPFFETSAASRENVDTAFHAVVSQIRRRERQLAASTGDNARDTEAMAGSHSGKNGRLKGVKGWINKHVLHKGKTQRDLMLVKTINPV